MLEQNPAHFQNRTRMSVNRHVIGVHHDFRLKVLAVCVSKDTAPSPRAEKRCRNESSGKTPTMLW